MAGANDSGFERGFLDELLRSASGDPLVALARLYRRLAADLPRWNAAVHTAETDPKGHDQRVRRFRDLLERGNAVAEVVPTTHALALLVAIDTFAFRERSGRSVATVRHVQAADVEAWVQQRPKNFTARVRRHSNQLQYWMRHHWVLPVEHAKLAIRIRTYEHHELLNTELDAALGAGELLVHVGGFDDGVEPDWTTPHPRYGCSDLTDPATRWSSIEERLRSAAAEHCRCLVLPELTVTPELRNQIARWLVKETHPFLLVVPGSFHEEREGKRRNFAVVFDRHGRELLQHEKLRPMRVDGKGSEDIVSGDSVELTPTPLGLLALAICLDFCDEDMPLKSLWDELGPGIVLVPSMSGKSTASAHERRAANLSREHATVSIVAIQPDALPADAEHRWSLVYGTGERTSPRWVQAEQSCSGAFGIGVSPKATEGR